MAMARKAPSSESYETPIQRGSHARSVLSPEYLAEALDRWALRREKLLPLLDVRAVRSARTLAAQARQVAYGRRVSDMTDPDVQRAWMEAWLGVRQRVAEFLAENAVRDEILLEQPPGA
jgi:hypothetical protein